MASRSSDPENLRRDLAAGRLSPVYLVCGDEPLLKEEAVERIRTAVLGESTAEASWNRTVLEGGSASLAEILDAARTVPMFAPRRLVWVRETERLREPEASPLREYLASPSPTTCLLFSTGSGKPDFRKGIFKALQSSAKVLEFQPLKGAVLTRWLRGRVQDLEAEIDEESLALLEMHAGPELLRLDQELKKVLDFLAPKRRITGQDLEQTLGTVSAASIFEWVDRTGDGEAGSSIRLLRALLAEGEEPTRLLFLLARHLRMLILGQSLVKSGLRGRDLALALGIPPYPFIIEKAQRQIQRFPTGAGGSALQRLLEADRAVKSGAGKPPGILERLILDLSTLLGAPASSAGARR
ncbi:MAG TPA: DNA polymerase III subunit delta [Candidatus Polarisedimenticolia bacterium]|nr:DNA polymerase III subunit delta [Candidatus Polarisedimenticolia bacterium]